MLEAHEHSYERLWPVYNLEVNNLNQPSLQIHGLMAFIVKFTSFMTISFVAGL